MVNRLLHMSRGECQKVFYSWVDMAVDTSGTYRELIASVIILR